MDVVVGGGGDVEVVILLRFFLALLVVINLVDGSVVVEDAGISSCLVTGLPAAPALSLLMVELGVVGLLLGVGVGLMVLSLSSVTVVVVDVVT